MKYLTEGCWAFPKTTQAVRKLGDLLSHPLDAKIAKKELYNIFGDDELFNILDDAEEREDTDVRGSVKRRLKKFLAMEPEKLKISDDVRAGLSRLVDGVPDEKVITLPGSRGKRGTGKLSFDPNAKADREYSDYHGYHDPKVNEEKLTFKQFLLKEGKKSKGDRFHDERVDFVEGWCDMNLGDYSHIEEADDAFWEDVNSNPERKAEAKRIGLTKSIAYDIMWQCADKMGLNDDHLDESMFDVKLDIADKKFILRDFKAWCGKWPDAASVNDINSYLSHARSDQYDRKVVRDYLVSLRDPEQHKDDHLIESRRKQ